MTLKICDYATKKLNEEYEKIILQCRSEEKDLKKLDTFCFIARKLDVKSEEIYTDLEMKSINLEKHNELFSDDINDLGENLEENQRIDYLLVLANENLELFRFSLLKKLYFENIFLNEFKDKIPSDKIKIVFDYSINFIKEICFPDEADIGENFIWLFSRIQLVTQALLMFETRTLLTLNLTEKDII